jgi:hypothetical protein
MDKANVQISVEIVTTPVMMAVTMTAKRTAFKIRNVRCPSERKMRRMFRQGKMPVKV